MAKIRYTAVFAGDVTVTRDYFKPLTHAVKVAFTNVKTGQSAEKVQFCGSEDNAKKAAKLSKAFKVDSVEIVATTGKELPQSAPKASKPKAVKPFAANDEVSITLAGAQVFGTVAKCGTKYAYVNVTGALDPIKVAFTNIIKLPVEPALELAA